MYTVRFFSHCGMAGLPETFAEESSDIGEAQRDARAYVADRLRAARASGVYVSTVETGAEWEIHEPEDCAMVPDSAGLLTLTRRTWECRECGSAHGSFDSAAECCAYDPSADEPEPECDDEPEWLTRALADAATDTSSDPEGT